MGRLSSVYPVLLITVVRLWVFHTAERGPPPVFNLNEFKKNTSLWHVWHYFLP